MQFRTQVIFYSVTSTARTFHQAETFDIDAESDSKVQDARQNE